MSASRLKRRRASLADNRFEPIDEMFECRFDSGGKWSRAPAGLERLLLSKEPGELIRGCMDGLPVNQRAEFVLREAGGVGTSEVCKILDGSVTDFGVLISDRNEPGPGLEERVIRRLFRQKSQPPV